MPFAADAGGFSGYVRWVILVDAYNVLHQWRGGPGHRAGPGQDVRALAHLVSRAVAGSQRVRLVCDGAAPAGGGWSVAGVEVVYAGKGHDADGVIIEEARASSFPGALTVVTSDRRIAGEVRKRGAVVVDSSVFLGRMVVAAAVRDRAPSGPRHPEVPLGEAEVGMWLREFGITLDHSEMKTATKARAGEPPAAREVGKRPEPYRSGGKGEVSVKSPRGAGGGGVSGPVIVEPWFEQARRVWPDLTLEDLRMDRWLDPPRR